VLNVPHAASYSATARLSDGRIFNIRALKREDEAGVMAAFARTSPQSLYRRFFGFKRFFSDQEIAYYMTVDSVNHVCLVAVMDEDSHPAIVGGVRYIVQGPGKAVIDEHQAKGMSTALMQHIAGVTREAGIREFYGESPA
jgi:N-acetylglutamate synthase-like GNAT family acetyltransferase